MKMPTGKVPTLSSGRSWFKYFQYEEGRDSPGDARNVILVVVTLIAAVTFQAGVNPPGGFWQEQDDPDPGTAIFASKIYPYHIFLISNTLALATSILVIVSLTYRFPFHFEIWVATGAMMVTYASAVYGVSRNELVSFRYVLIAAPMPCVIRCLIHLFNKWISFKKSQSDVHPEHPSP